MPELLHLHCSHSCVIGILGLHGMNAGRKRRPKPLLRSAW